MPSPPSALGLSPGFASGFGRDGVVVDLAPGGGALDKKSKKDISFSSLPALGKEAQRGARGRGEDIRLIQQAPRGHGAAPHAVISSNERSKRI